MSALAVLGGGLLVAGLAVLLGSAGRSLLARRGVHRELYGAARSLMGHRDGPLANATATMGTHLLRPLERWRGRGRVARFEAELPDALDLLAGALEAGAPLAQGMQLVAAEGSAPIAAEFQRILADHRIGASFTDAFEASAVRIGSRDFLWCAQVVRVQQEFGASLAGVLRTVAEFMRWRLEIRGEVRALTAEGRISAIVLTAVPVLLVAFFVLVNPAYLSLLVTRPLGWLMTISAVFLLVFGTLWMRRIVRVEV